MTPVTVGEVVRHAKPGCKSCNGSGAIARWFWLDIQTQQRREEICRCARKRFLKKHDGKIETAGGDWKWKVAA
jgi:hypothetical protein